jgi:hypothetical protein
MQLFPKVNRCSQQINRCESSYRANKITAILFERLVEIGSFVVEEIHKLVERFEKLVIWQIVFRWIDQMVDPVVVSPKTASHKIPPRVFFDSDSFRSLTENIIIALSFVMTLS